MQQKIIAMNKQTEIMAIKRVLKMEGWFALGEGTGACRGTVQSSEIIIVP